MTDINDDIVEVTNKLNIQSMIQDNGNSNNSTNGSELVDEVITTDSDEYLSEPLRYRNFQYSTDTTNSNVTIVAQNNMEDPPDNIFFSNGTVDFSNIQIPIVGYEIMEERARFTVYKLRIENKSTSDCWYVFRRYTDFVRLCNRLRNSHPHIVKHLPRKRWLKNNFDPVFLEERVSGLQLLVNSILNETDLVVNQEIQDFFCLNEPPIYSETNEESRAIFEALEETINDLKLQLQEKESVIDNLQDKLHAALVENENLKKMTRNCTLNCQKCEKDYQNFSKVIK